MNTIFKVIGLTRLEIRPKSTAPEADALTTRPSELLNPRTILPVFLYTRFLKHFTSWVFKRHFVQDCHNFSIAQWMSAAYNGKCCTNLGSPRRGFGLFRFSGFGLDRLGSIRIRVTWG